MKANKIIRYRLSVSRTFPATHQKAGQETFFLEMIDSAMNGSKVFNPKIHTIRGNYQLWQKRFEKIEKGEAVLELYYWTGKPYNSPSETFLTLTKEDGIGLQKLYFASGLIDFPRIQKESILALAIRTIAKNDGISAKDFKEWFKGSNLLNSLAIIHFTKFRY